MKLYNTTKFYDNPEEKKKKKKRKEKRKQAFSPHLSTQIFQRISREFNVLEQTALKPPPPVSPFFSSWQTFQRKSLGKREREIKKKRKTKGFASVEEASKERPLLAV